MRLPGLNLSRVILIAGFIVFLHSVLLMSKIVNFFTIRG